MSMCFRKLALCLLLIVLVGTIVKPFPAQAYDISNAIYVGTIAVTNNSSTAKTNVVVTMTLNPVTLKSIYDIDDSWTYVAIVASSGAAAPFMPSNNATNEWCLFIPSIAGSQTINYLLYIGHSDLLCDKYYFPGTTGMSVADHSTIELLGNGAVSFTNSFIDTSGNYTIFEKPGAIGAYSVKTPTSANVSVRMFGYGNAANYPYVASNVTGQGNATSFATSLPAGTTTGDLLILVADDWSAAGAGNMIIPAGGWATSSNGTHTIGNSQTVIWWKVAASGMTAPTVTMTGAAHDYSWEMLRIPNGYYSGTPTAGVWASNAAGNADPPALTSGFSSNMTLYLAVGVNPNGAFTARPANYSVASNITRANTAICTAYRKLSAASDNPGAFTQAVAGYWGAQTLAIRGYVYIEISSAVTSAEKALFTASANATSGRLELWQNGALLASKTRGGATVVNNANAWQFGSSGGTPYIDQVSVTVNGTLQSRWYWENAATYADHGIRNNTATPSFPTTSSDSDVSAVLTSFAPIALALPPAFNISDAPDFITGNTTTEGQFTSGNVSSTGGPPGFSFISEIANAGKVPNIWLFGMIALCITVCGHFFWVWMQRRYGFRTMWPFFLTGAAVIGLFIALGGTVKVFDFWMMFFYILIFICLMVMSRHTEVGGNVSTHGLIGFCAQSWIGLTVINRTLEGAFVGSTDTSWVNHFAFTQDFKLFDIFSVPVLNTDFWTVGVPSLIRWDYSFFGGNAQMFEYLLYALTAVVAFILFGMLIGLLYNFFK